MITPAQANDLQFSRSTLTDADLSPGPDEGSSVPADTVAEVFNVQVGASDAGNLADALAMVVGVPADKFKSTAKAKPTVDFADGGEADVDDATQFQIAKRRRQSRGGRDITGRLLEDQYSEVPLSEREDLTPREPGVREDEVLTILAYNPSSAITVSLENSTIRLPIQTGL